MGEIAGPDPRASGTGANRDLDRNIVAGHMRRHRRFVISVDTGAVGGDQDAADRHADP